jgi:hypothetical protein
MLVAPSIFSPVYHTYFCLFECARVSGLNGHPLGGKEGVRLAAFVMKPSYTSISQVVT